jgi:hypothetical protein
MSRLARRKRVSYEVPARTTRVLMAALRLTPEEYAHMLAILDDDEMLLFLNPFTTFSERRRIVEDLYELYERIEIHTNGKL